MMLIYVLLIVLAVILFFIGVMIGNIQNKIMKSEMESISYDDESDGSSTPEIINSEIIEEFLEI